MKNLVLSICLLVVMLVSFNTNMGAESTVTLTNNTGCTLTFTNSHGTHYLLSPHTAITSALQTESSWSVSDGYNIVIAWPTGNLTDDVFCDKDVTIYCNSDELVVSE